MDIRKTANLLINFIIRRLAEIFGVMVFASGILIIIALLTYTPDDPNFIFPITIQLKYLDIEGVLPLTIFSILRTCFLSIFNNINYNWYKYF